MSWLRKKTEPQAQLEREILRQWQTSRLVDRLAELPADLFLRSQIRKMENRAAAEGETMDCPRVHRKLLPRIRRKIGSASRKSVAWLSRRRCLQPARRFMIKTARRLVLKVLVLCLRQVRLKSLGKQTISASSLTKLSRAPNNPESANGKPALVRRDLVSRR
jgi:hypothetical protein